MLRTVFMGSDAIALPLLNWLVDEAPHTVTLAAVYTQPDRAVGRGQKVQPNAIKLWALERGLPVHQPEKLTPEDLAQLKSYQPDVTLIMAYGHILRQDFIAAPRLGTLNLHTSLLPKYRGASPIQTAIAAGERETGVTLMRIVPALDAGPIADVERVGIGAWDTALEVEAKLAGACVPLLARSLRKLATGTLAFAEQDAKQATFCRKLEKADGVLDFTAPAAQLAARINGLFPWPACSVEIRGQPVKLGLADVITADQGHVLSDNFSDADSFPGKILGDDAEGVLVATGQGALRLRRLQRSGGKMLSAAEFVRGFPINPGSEIASRPMAALVSESVFPRIRV
jgi:methionyl-tRNA formyltransferase